MEERKQAILENFIINSYNTTCNYISGLIQQWGYNKYGVIPNVNIKWEENFGSIPIWYDGVIKIYTENRATKYRMYPFGCVCNLGYLINAMNMVDYVDALEKDLIDLSVIIQKDQLFLKRERFRAEIRRCAYNNISHSWLIDEILFPDTMAKVLLPFCEGFYNDELPDCEVEGNVIISDTQKLFMKSIKRLII